VANAAHAAILGDHLDEFIASQVRDALQELGSLQVVNVGRVALAVPVQPQLAAVLLERIEQREEETGSSGSRTTFDDWMRRTWPGFPSQGSRVRAPSSASLKYLHFGPCCIRLCRLRRGGGTWQPNAASTSG
jgi:hypothetical protein